MPPLWTLAVASAAALAACGGVDALATHQQRLLASRATFDEAGDSYAYVRAASSWVGWTAETTVTVERGQVVSRRFVSWATDPATGARVPEESWLEEGAAIGSHEGGFPAKPLSALYDECMGEVLPSAPEASQLTLEFDAAGLLRACFFVPTHCADDCTFGIRLDSIELPPPS